MSVFAAKAPQISAMEARIGEIAISCREYRPVVEVCVVNCPEREMAWRDHSPRFCVITSEGEYLVQPRYCAMQAILLILFLCTAFFCGDAALADARARSVAAPPSA